MLLPHIAAFSLPLLRPFFRTRQVGEDGALSGRSCVRERMTVSS